MPHLRLGCGPHRVLAGASGGELLGSIGLGINTRMKNGLIGYWVAALPFGLGFVPAFFTADRGEFLGLITRIDLLNSLRRKLR